MEIIEQNKEKFDKAIDYLKQELGKLKTGRANSALVENIIVNAYGIKTPLQQLAAISIPEPRQIVIQPWDKGISKDIEKALSESGLGLNPVAESDLLRINLPDLTEEGRKDLVKILHQKIEDGRVATRNIREEIWKKLKQQEVDKEITQDDLYAGQKALQEIIDEYNARIKTIGEEKEKEIMTV